MRLPEPPGLRPPSSIAGIPAATPALTNDRPTVTRAQLQIRLQAELAEWRALYRKLAPAQAWLEGRIAFSEEPQRTELEARKRELDRKAREAERCIAQAHADIDTLSDTPTTRSWPA